MFARWWDNFQESCDIRLAVGCGCAVAWVLLVAISPVLSTASTFIGAGLSWRSGIVVGGVLANGRGPRRCLPPAPCTKGSRHDTHRTAQTAARL